MSTLKRILRDSSGGWYLASDLYTHTYFVPSSITVDSRGILYRYYGEACFPSSSA